MAARAALVAPCRHGEAPPGPRINLIQTARYARDPYGYMIAMQRKYGDPFTVPTLNGVLC